MIILWGIFVTVCFAGKNTDISSFTNKKYTFDKTEKIYLDEKNRGTEEVDSIYELLQNSLIEAGFVLVDSIEQADRFIVFSFHDDIKVGKMKISGNYQITDDGNETPIDNPTVELDVNKNTEGKIGLKVVLYDITDGKLLKKTPELSWQVFLSTDKEIFNKDTKKVIKRLLHYYGKDINKSFNIKVSKK